MWRAFFSAIGIVMVVFGLECLVIDEAILANRKDPISQQAHIQTASLFGSSASNAFQATSRFRPSESIPWGLLASGAVVCLYAMSYKNP